MATGCFGREGPERLDDVADAIGALRERELV